MTRKTRTSVGRSRRRTLRTALAWVESQSRLDIQTFNNINRTTMIVPPSSLVTHGLNPQAHWWVGFIWDHPVFGPSQSAADRARENCLDTPHVVRRRVSSRTTLEEQHRSLNIGDLRRKYLQGAFLDREERLVVSHRLDAAPSQITSIVGPTCRDKFLAGSNRTLSHDKSIESDQIVEFEKLEQACMNRTTAFTSSITSATY